MAVADGSVRFVGTGMDRKLATVTLIIDDGDSFLPGGKTVERTKWGNVLLLAICIVLTLLPVPWVWRRESETTVSPIENASSKTGGDGLNDPDS